VVAVSWFDSQAFGGWLNWKTGGERANVDTTLNVYTQVLDGSLRNAVEEVGGELFTDPMWRGR
jgi:hypothetical protein